MKSRMKELMPQRRTTDARQQNAQFDIKPNQINAHTLKGWPG